MNEIKLKNYEFEDYLLDNVKLFDEVLGKLGEPQLFENQNFAVCSAFEVFPNYLVMENTHKVKNSLPITIWFEVNDLRIDIDGIPETFEWAKKHIDQDRNSVIGFIENLFTGFFLIDYRGSSGRFIQIFDSNGDFVDCRSRNNLFHMITGWFLFRFNGYRKLFLPLFSRPK